MTAGLAARACPCGWSLAGDSGQVQVSRMAVLLSCGRFPAAKAGPAGGRAGPAFAAGNPRDQVLVRARGGNAGPDRRGSPAPGGHQSRERAERATLVPPGAAARESLGNCPPERPGLVLQSPVAVA